MKNLISNRVKIKFGMNIVKNMMVIFLILGGIFSQSLQAKEDVSEKIAKQWMKDFPKPWRMRLSDGRYKWSYTHALVLKGFEELYKETGDQELSDYIKSYVDYFVTTDGDIKTYEITEYNIDSINAGKMLFSLYKKTNDPRYKKAMDHLMVQLKWHPRTKGGSYWHKRKYPWQVWLDGLYMAQPFVAEYAKSFDLKKEYNDDVIQQFKVIYEKTLDPKTGLLLHGWDESALQKWADPKTGLSKHFWTRSMGWYVMALVDTLDHLDADSEDEKVLKSILVKVIDALLEVEDPKTKLWYQVTDQGARKGNYIEISGSSMIIYGLAKGVNRGYLSAKYAPFAVSSYDALVKGYIKQDESTGRLSLINICRSAGLGGTPYRDGSYEYYLSEEIVSNDAHGIGSFILAAQEIKRLKAN